MKGRLGPVFLAIGAVVYLAGLTVGVYYLGIFLLVLGIVFLVLGFYVWRREARRLPWPRPPPMPPTVGEQIAQRNRDRDPVSTARAMRRRKVIFVVFSALLLLAGFAVLASQSAELMFAFMFALLAGNTVRLLFYKRRQRRVL